MIVATQTVNRTSTSRPNLRSSRPNTRTLHAIHAQHHLALIPTGWGNCAIVWKLPPEHSSFSPTGFMEGSGQATLCQIITPGLALDDLRRSLLSRYPNASEVLADRAGNFHPEIVPTWFPELSRRLQSYYTTHLRGRVGPDFSDSWRFWRLQLDWSQLTAFQRAVLEIVAAISRGERYTYGRVAHALGKPHASRAVGAALGANPWPVLVPCHRVVGANGSMTGFSAPGGISAKRRMLEMESAPSDF